MKMTDVGFCATSCLVTRGRYHGSDASSWVCGLERIQTGHISLFNSQNKHESGIGFNKDKYVTQCSIANNGDELLKQYFAAAIEGRYLDLVPMFSEDAVYHDMLYPQPFRGKTEIAKHMQNMEGALGSVRFVLDDMMASNEKGSARWHGETTSGALVPFSRGVSMFTFTKNDKGDMLISEAWEVVETPLKVAGIVLPIVRGASWILSKLQKEKK